jgi:hypothetical protein
MPFEKSTTPVPAHAKFTGKCKVAIAPEER